MASTLVGVLYSLYLTRVKKETKPNTKEELERILQAMKEGITKDQGVIRRKKKILQVRQKEDEPIQIWGVRVEQQLSDYKEEGIHTLIETFIKGLRDKEIKKEMRGEAAARKDFMIEKIMELVKRQQIKIEALTELNNKKALKKGRERVVAPVIVIQLNISMY